MTPEEITKELFGDFEESWLLWHHRVESALRAYGDHRAEEMRGRFVTWLAEDAGQYTIDTPLIDLLAEKAKALPLAPPPAR